MATVLKIPAKFHPITHLPETKVQKRRVAAYARVSTDSEEQQTSYAAQVDRYTKYIQERADWEFVAVYTDEGISALNTKHRDGFNRMVADALDGKIDLIVTKSVSRFARNTVDSLTTVRKLKEKGVEVFFEKENIYTLDSKGELLITIMSSLAQEESRSISENVTWGQRKRMARSPARHISQVRTTQTAAATAEPLAVVRPFLQVPAATAAGAAAETTARSKARKTVSGACSHKRSVFSLLK